MKTYKEFKGLTEATVKTQKYSWGTMKTVHQGSDFSIPLHPEHHQEIAKLKDEQEHKFKDETGRHWVARRKGDMVHFDTTGNGSMKAEVPMKHIAEETLSEDHIVHVDDGSKYGEEPHDADVVHVMAGANLHGGKFDGHSDKGAYFKFPTHTAAKDFAAHVKRAPHKTVSADIHEEVEQVQEVLSPEMGAGEYIKDFQKSTNPKFEGKSKEKRRQMAIAAFMAAKRAVSEGVIQSSGTDEIPVAGNTVAPVAPVPARKYIKGTPEWKAHKAKSKPINGHPTNVKEEVEELDEKFINGREYASQGIMHPDHAKMSIHQKTGQEVDFYAHGTGDKIQGKVTKNDGKEVHIQANKDSGGKLHKFRVSANLPQPVDEGRNVGDVPFDKPYKTITNKEINVKDKSGAVHTPMSRARDLARQAMKKQVKESLDLDITDDQAEELVEAVKKAEKKMELPSGAIKTSEKAVKADTEEGWDDPKKAVKESVQKVNVPAYLRKLRGDKPLELKDLKRKDTISDSENLRKASGVSENAKLSYKEFAMMLEYETKDGRYVHKGTYGGSYQDPEGADDADDAKPKKQPAEKRGRGRPAGAKSGARKITGTSKLFK